MIQDQTGRTPRAWSKTGIVVEVLPHNSYHIRIDGSNHVTKHNRHFLRKIIPFSPDYPNPPPSTHDLPNTTPTGTEMYLEQNSTADPAPQVGHISSAADNQVPVEPGNQGNHADSVGKEAVKDKPKHLKIMWIVNPVLQRMTQREHVLTSASPGPA